MDTGEKMTVLENLIYQYACTQFELNQIPPSEARIVMKCVYSRFQELSLNNDLMSRVSIQQAGAPSKEVKRTGTPEELMEDFKKTGFYPAGKEPDLGEEDKDDNS